jgi:glycosyltransferase involved in cell wall biosynthesis
MMDLWATVPYYDAYLCRALQSQDVLVTLASITYYLDPKCFSERGLRNRPGLVDVVGNFQLPKSLRRSLKFAEAMLNMLANAVRMFFVRPDVLHVQFLPLLKWGIALETWFLLYCRRLGIKLVYTVHDLLPHDTGDRHRERFLRLYRMMDALICHSESAKQKLLANFEIATERIWIIPHGPFFYDCAVSLREHIRAKYNATSGECLVLWQGLIFPYKGIDFLLDSWVDVQRAGAKVRLVIAGTGSPELLAAIVQRAESLGISGSVTFDFRFLPVEELTALYDAADIVVYPYKNVTTSGALLTGVALGKPIIATNLPAFAEMLEHGENAFLVQYGDIEALADSILRLASEPKLRLQLGARVKELNSGDETWRAIAKQTKECYLSVMRGKLNG